MEASSQRKREVMQEEVMPQERHRFFFDDELQPQGEPQMKKRKVAKMPSEATGKEILLFEQNYF